MQAERQYSKRRMTNTGFPTSASVKQTHLNESCLDSAGTHRLQIKTLGSLDGALEVFQSMFNGSMGYRKLIGNYLCEKNLAVESELPSLTPEQILERCPFSQLPQVNKQNFFAKHTWVELLPRELYKNIFSVYRSSGSTQTQLGARGFFWPISRADEREALPVIQKMLTEAFRLQEKRTLVIVGLSLGSWAGGEQFSFLFKNLAFMSELDLVFFAPGNQHHEILEVIEKFGDEFDQILLAMCPSAIFYLHKLAESTGAKLPLKKFTYVVTGETFSETYRLDLKNYLGQSMADLTMLSIYGSADTGFVGFESLPLIRLRQHLHRHPELAKELGFGDGVIPNLFHVQVNDGYYENVDGELVVTKWQGIPLVRYNLHDRVDFFSWKKTCLRLAELDPKKKSFWLQFSTLPLTDFVCVSGRTSGCLIWGESKIYEETLCDIFQRSSLASLSTGNFIVWLEVYNGQQQLHWQVELKDEIQEPTNKQKESWHSEFIELLTHIHLEFNDDFQNIYRPLVEQGTKLFEFHFCQNPYLANHPQLKSNIKRKIRIESGPL